VDSYLKRARELVTLGDIAAARLLLSRASEGKDSRALVALAETYDPVVLRGWRVVGLRADPDRARALYEEASEAGNKTAGEHLLAMK
jgi:TPR repeat protein